MTNASLGKTLLAFALLHSAFQGQICLSLQVFLHSPTFAWLGLYTSFLIPSSVIGIIVFLYGCATIEEDIPR